MHKGVAFSCLLRTKPWLYASSASGSAFKLKIFESRQRFFNSTKNPQADDFKSIKYWRENRVAHIQLNRPKALNAIDHLMPSELQTAVQMANWDPEVRVILLYGAQNSFCSGYDLKLFAEKGRDTCGSQEMPWDPAIDYR